MIAADERLDRALRLADPGAIGTPVEPSVEDEVRAALAWADRHPVMSAPADGHGRRVTSTVVVAALAAAAVLIIPLVAPPSSPLSAPYASAADLHEVASNARATAGAAAATTTYRDRAMMAASTPTGVAYYWQDSRSTHGVTSTETTWTFVSGPPSYLTPADEQKAETMPADDRPSATTTTQRLSAADLTWPTADAMAKLPTSANELSNALPADICDGPGCQFTLLQTILEFPGTTGPQRAAALDLMAVTPGVTVLGPRVVNGHRGLEVRLADARTPAAPDVTYVFDSTDGTQLAEYDSATAEYLAATPFPVAPGTVIWQRERAD